MKTVLTFGVFDMLHTGHVILFRRARELGDRLIVAVQDGDYILKYKPEAKIVCSTEERRFLVGSIRFVDATVIYRDVDKDIQTFDFDIFVKGPDQNHEGFRRAEQWCREHGKEVITLPRTEGVSSSLFRTLDL